MRLDVHGPVQTRTFRVLWMLEELGLDYTHHPDPPRSQAVRDLSPLGKVPVLVAGGTVIPDSLAILHFLADSQGRLTAPAGTPARARQDAMTFRICDEMDALLWTAARHSFVLPEEHRVREVKPALKWEYARNCAGIGAALAGPFVMGEDFTLTDILLTHCLGWGIAARFGVPDPALSAYLERMKARPAWRRVQAMAG